MFVTGLTSNSALIAGREAQCGGLLDRESGTVADVDAGADTTVVFDMSRRGRFGSGGECRAGRVGAWVGTTSSAGVC